LIELYQSSAAQIVAELRSSYASSDRALLRRAAHKLKGASANVSAEGMAALCKTLESSVEHEAPTQLLQQVDAIERLMAKTQQAMQGYLSAMAYS
jgi:HPt (histidine-containing phosphotransfer) domain-containing protein